MNNNVAKWIILPLIILIASAGVVTRIINLIDISYLLSQIMMIALVLYFYFLIYKKSYGLYTIKHVVSFSIIALCALCFAAYSAAMILGLFESFTSIKSILQTIMTFSYGSLMLIVILFFIINLSSLINPTQISKG
jgi:hypothetical protein